MTRKRERALDHVNISSVIVMSECAGRWRDRPRSQSPWTRRSRTESEVLRCVRLVARRQLRPRFESCDRSVRESNRTGVAATRRPLRRNQNDSEPHQRITRKRPSLWLCKNFRSSPSQGSSELPLWRRFGSCGGDDGRRRTAGGYESVYGRGVVAPGIGRGSTLRIRKLLTSSPCSTRFRPASVRACADP